MNTSPIRYENESVAKRLQYEIYVRGIYPHFINNVVAIDISKGYRRIFTLKLFTLKCVVYVIEISYFDPKFMNGPYMTQPF